ncbi:unnamed protein product [Enterobius vermicularis]|uniref:Kunitz/Bovine pancreatic trypsin inhibitor domain protein n=1 Tax=Enterobius vermicularis TaxID=51028 RepID=A0A158QAX8_ENTVE|nr:unnamed protein product [Enterobius vermicularis]
MVATETREGTVCHFVGQCPTNGENPLLYLHNTDILARCFPKNDRNEKDTAVFKGCDDLDDMYDCLAGVCCPTRAFTCVQPLELGDIAETAESVERWYYDSTVDDCKKFNFTGRGGNANNFISQTQCQSYCRNRCRRGNPQRRFLETEDAVVKNTENIYCLTTENGFFCCPPPSNYYSKVIVTIYRSKIYCRWYWDKNEKRCMTFQYLGQGGNFNNFLTEEQCIKFCHKAVCPIGTALRYRQESWVECAESAQCPVTHYCYMSRCCPTASTICTQPLLNSNSCNGETSVRYWFNVSSSLCEPFLFADCQQNDNSFATVESCQEFCGVTEPGLFTLTVSITPITQKYLDENGQVVHCEGENDFHTCPDTHRCTELVRISYCCPLKGTLCSLPIEKGHNCTSSEIRFGFDSELGVCKSFQYGGCSGNANNFLSLQFCIKFCYSAVCAPMEVVYIALNSTTAFNCEKATCPEGYVCVKNEMTRQSVCCGLPTQDVCPGKMVPFVGYYDVSLRTCDPSLLNSCAAGFQCLFYTYLFVFKFGSQLAINPLTGDPMGCNSDGNCNSLDKCFGSDELTSGFCCTRKNIACPASFELDEKRTNAGECTPLITTSCSTNHQSICLYSSALSRFVCCRRESRSPTTLARCPSRTVQDPNRRFCSVGVSCPLPYLCVRPNSDHVGICCKPNVPVAPRLVTKRNFQFQYIVLRALLEFSAYRVLVGCRRGSRPLYDVSTGDVQICSERRPCPAPYRVRQNII